MLVLQSLSGPTTPLTGMFSTRQTIAVLVIPENLLFM